MGCVCCGTGVAVGFVVEEFTVRYWPSGHTVLPWEIATMKEAQRATLRTEVYKEKIPVAYIHEACPNCEAGRSRALRLAGREVPYTEPPKEKKEGSSVKRYRSDR